ncbi:MAG TPA: type I methionyl aminopeptidase [Synergistaceae bacterium]|jgi:methionyl aminopeptidase|nr:type I methionyl aminopeptidase [Synergistaceae bacterium]NLL41011.1 type I methionyl aminopeptidase [Synergistaceae bacterium]HPX03724.1 type I methionyl aminopeptidase [Synergistaceae bacterium]HQA54622.1 type I methionyl aminopeptidase [Synergistaceae bacterium]
MITFKSDRDLEKMRHAGRIVADILRLMRDMVRPGVDTYTLDQAAEALVLKENARPAFKGYKVPWVSVPFPGTICASVNDEIVHGIPSRERVLQDGDIISIDTGVSYNGFFGDAACTFAVGKISEDRQRLLDITLESLHRGVNAVKAGATLGDIGHAIESIVIPSGFGLVRDYAGHGIGRRLHEAPQVPNYGTAGSGITLKAGMTFCIEPMVMSGSEEVKNLSDNWTVVTADGSDAAHFEHSILVTPDGAEILTPWE